MFASVWITQDGCGWVVVIVENETENRRTFEIEQHARSFADGQRIRLGLPPLEHRLIRDDDNSDGLDHA